MGCLSISREEKMHPHTSNTCHSRYRAAPCLALLMFGLLICSGTDITFAQEREDTAVEEFLAWAEEVAIPVDLSQDIDPQVLAPLLEGKRIVYLAEPDHFVEEKYAFRLAFLRPLHELGWRHLGEEMGRSSGLRFDSYLHSGDEAGLRNVGFYAGIARASSSTAQGGFIEAEFAYARSVREMGQGAERWCYFGFDVDKFPGDGIEDARRRISGLEEGSELRLLLERAWRAENRIGAITGLAERLTNWGSGLSSELPSEQLHELTLDLLGLRESLAFRGSLHDCSWEGFLRACERREEFMCALVDSYMEGVAPDTRVVLTGHNLHLGRSWKGVRWRGMTLNPLNLKFPIEAWPTVGSHICERNPSKILSVWLTFDRSKPADARQNPQLRRLPSISGTIESLLASLPHDALLLPLESEDPRSDWLDEERTYRVNDDIGWGRLRQQTDVLLFVREVTPLPTVSSPTMNLAPKSRPPARPEPEGCEILKGGDAIHPEYVSLCEDPCRGHYVLCVGGPEAARNSKPQLTCRVRGRPYSFNGWHSVEGDEWGHQALFIRDPEMVEELGRELGVAPVGFDYSGTRLVAEFRLAQEVYDRDEDVWVELIVTNTGDQPMQCFVNDLPPKGERKERFSFKVSRSGKRARWRSAKTGRTIRKDRAAIEPGGKFTDRALLDNWASTTRPGEYRVEVSYEFETVPGPVDPDCAGICPVIQSEFPLSGAVKFIRR